MSIIPEEFTEKKLVFKIALRYTCIFWLLCFAR